VTRRDFIPLLGGAAAALPLAVRAQQLAKVARIGFLGYGSQASIASWVEALRAGLLTLGYIEGINIVIEYRWTAENDRLPDVAAELVGLNIDLIVTWGTPGTRAAKQATTTIPIVMAISGDAVATGIVSNLARPDGNVTGSTIFNPELCAKRLEILQESFPGTKRVAIFLNPDNPVSKRNLQAAELTAASRKLELQVFEARQAKDFASAFSEMAARPVDAITAFEDPLIFAHTRTMVDIALERRLPSIGYLDFAEAGGLIAYGVDFPKTFRRAAVFVDKILKGAKPSELPIEQPTKFKLVLNLKTAKMLGLEFPPMMLARADEVIE
jgi:putative tryptophan/tyrosine transport system substrate-binding protein